MNAVIPLVGRTHAGLISVAPYHDPVREAPELLVLEFENRKKTMGKLIIPAERIERNILLIRGEKVILDVHLAELYGVTTGALNQAVKRNLERFPPDFMFQLTHEETEEVITICDNLAALRFRPKRPHAFTEQGVAMLSSVLRSDRAVRVNVEIMRTFVKLRRLLATHADLAAKLDQLEQRYDSKFRVVFDAIRHLMADTEKPRRKPPIGFLTEAKPRKRKPL